LNYGSDGYNLVLERLEDENIDWYREWF
jgi:uncharacterized protein YerC